MPLMVPERCPIGRATVHTSHWPRPWCQPAPQADVRGSKVERINWFNYGRLHSEIGDVPARRTGGRLPAMPSHSDTRWLPINSVSTEPGAVHLYVVVLPARSVTL